MSTVAQVAKNNTPRPNYNQLQAGLRWLADALESPQGACRNSEAAERYYAEAEAAGALTTITQVMGQLDELHLFLIDVQARRDVHEAMAEVKAALG